jgi:DNA polymerase-3 subunit gamma/tau
VAGVAEPSPQAYGNSTNVAAPVTPPVRQISTVDAGDWPGLIETAGLKGPVGALAQHCTLIAVEEHAVRLTLKSEHEHFSAPPLVAAMEEKLGLALGRAVKVRFEKGTAAQQRETPAEAAGRVRDARQQAAERAMNEDPIVQALMRDFDARLIPESVKPLN